MSHRLVHLRMLFGPLSNDIGNIEQITFEVFLLVILLVGNITVLTVIIVEGQKSRMHFFIKNLAVADLLCGIFFVIPRIAVHSNDGIFYGGNTLCKLQEFLSNIGIYGSNMIMIALSIDRLHILIRPLGSLASRGRNPTIICIFCWVAAVIVSVTGPIVFKYDAVYQQCYVDLDHSDMKIYFTVIFVFVFVIPTIIIVGCYSTIAVIIWRVSARNEGYQMKEKPSVSRQHSKLLSSRQSSTSSGSEHDDSNSSISKAKMKTIRMTFVIALAFVCCWAPYMIFNLLSVYDQIPRTPEIIRVAIFMEGLLPLNSVVNPLIYGVFSIRVCKQCRKHVTRRLSTSRSTRKTDQLFL
ncbi:cardioacceleratory peptide receptor-like [Saccostrea echinata]|uniref:cardioacceleratory peptide receptor-like n=1 Tax=Saccostrea echinata TaxID=191078 RepID=UPI002A80E9BD|nr:cardioacceleratory peptide receptor-like [Saccostrea echinata]